MWIVVTETELDAVQRLRTVVSKLARLLRLADIGSGVELTPTRVSVLLSTDRVGPVRLGALAERQGLHPTLLSRTVARLVAQGLIERTPDTDDRRSAWVTVTAAGRVAAARIRRERVASLRGALSQLAAEDHDAIVVALPAIERLAQALAGGHQ